MGHQFLNTASQHTSVGPRWEAGGWQRRKGSLRGEVLKKGQHDPAQTPCADANLRRTKELYTLGHQHLLSAGRDSLEKKSYGIKREKWLICCEHLVFVSGNVNAHLLSSVSVSTTAECREKCLFHTQQVKYAKANGNCPNTLIIWCFQLPGHSFCWSET